MTKNISCPPILLIIFNRPDLTQRVFARIREARPAHLFVAADGPRPDHPGEEQICAATRRVVDQVDWPCEVKTLFREQNMGCKVAVSSAISWFFDNVEEGIILEDDCLPHPTFFRFCEELLEKYRDNERVMHISGDNFQFGRTRGEASYYFSRYAHIWGWASWRRAWRHYDVQMRLWTCVEDQEVFLRDFDNPAERRFWKAMWNGVSIGKIDTWDFQWAFACLARRALSIIPNVNLVSNIGFGIDSTHTTEENNVANHLPTSEVEFPLSHPNAFAPGIEADEHTSELFFRMPSVSTRVFARVNRIVHKVSRLSVA